MLTPIKSGELGRFPIGEYRERLQSFRDELESRGIDLYLGTTPEHFNYFAGYDPTGVFYYQQQFFTPAMDEPVLLVHKVESEIARVTSWIGDIRSWAHGEDPFDRTLQMVREFAPPSSGRIGIEMDNWYLKSSTYARLLEALPEYEFVDVTDIGYSLRSVKSPAEVEYMRAAARLADLGLAAAVESIHPGVTEFEVNAAIQSALAKAGSEYAAFPTIVGSGPRSGIFHSIPSERKIELGDPIMIELGGVVARYNSNIVRTAVCGSASPFVRDLHDIVLDSYWNALDAVAPGVPVGEIDRLARAPRKGYEEFIPARSGFGVELAYPPVWLSGLSILEGSDRPLEEGMVFSLEPSISMYEGVSVIFGSNVLVTANGYEVLHSTPAELIETNAGMTNSSGAVGRAAR